MPSPLALSVQAYRQAAKKSYVCPTCLLLAAQTVAQHHKPYPKIRRLSSQEPPARSRGALDGSKTRPNRSEGRLYRSSEYSLSRRYASNGSLASSTAINAPSSVPQKYRELHQSLLALQETANSYVDRSRLQLVLRSLGSSRPVTRVAFTGLGERGPSAARKLARALLSDALGEEEAWERELLAGLEDGRSLLLRYGDVEEPVQSNLLVKTMNVPSRYLKRHNLEVLITPLNASDSSLSPDVYAIADAVLVPSLTTPNGSDGRVGFVRYPVHKSVIVAEGVTGAIEYGRLPSTLADGKLIKAAVSVSLAQPHQAGPEIAAPEVDVDLANHALNLFRTSKANGAQFSDEWQTSRLSDLSEWISGSSSSPVSLSDQSTMNLISSVLSRTSIAVKNAGKTGTDLAAANTIPESKRAQLYSGIAEWSAYSHKDLQTNLDTAFATSESWMRTVWWRLFWRIDDVAVSASDVLRQDWLTEAEKRLAYLSGQLVESRVASVTELQQVPQMDNEVVQSLADGQLVSTPSRFSTSMNATDNTSPFEFPWPPAISLSRLHMLNTLVPEFHRKAQTLLVVTLSTITGSAGLAALFYAATGGVALYESGAILSLGIVWSLRRLQKKWENQRATFASATREDARQVLGEVEGHLRRLVQQGGRVAINAEDAKSWEGALVAIDRSQKALEKATERS